MVIPLRNEGLREGERYLSQEEWEAKKRGCSAMVEQHPKPSYADILRELDIPLISPNNNHLCHSKLVNAQKNADIHKNKGFKIKHLNGLRFRENECIFLSFQDNEFRVVIISQNREKGGFYT